MSRETAFGILVVVTTSNGAEQRFTVDSAQATVGSGAHCEVRLAPELVAREHVRLVAVDGAVRFEARSGEPLVLWRGVPTAAGRLDLPEGLRIGGLLLTASVVSLADTKKRFPLELLALGPAALAVALAFALSPTASAPGRPPQGPPLFAAAQASCPSSDPFDAGQAARERLAMGAAKRERGPFSARDSVEAVGHFQVASSCFKVAGSDASAKEAAASATILRLKLEEEYMTRRTRLEHAFTEGDTDGVDRELSTLTSMTSHLEGPYVDWLRREQRRAEASKLKPKSSLL